MADTVLKEPALKERSVFSWLMEWALPHKGSYIASVVLAIIGVACSIAPYFAVTKIVFLLLQGSKEFADYIPWLAFAGLLWVLKTIFHSLSTTLSHKATFQVIAEARTAVTQKLTRLPMGYLLDTPSGKLKNIIVERIDSIETTLAHLVPELSSNVLVPVCLIGYLFVLDWRMALVFFVTFPIGVLVYSGVFKDHEVRYNHYLKSNHILNSVAVEYINGIEVIKAFNRRAASYKTFTDAAQAAADSAIEWMRASINYFSAAMAILPSTMVSILPAGSYFYMKGSLSAETFIMLIIISMGIMPPLIVAMSHGEALSKTGLIVKDITSILKEEDIVRPANEAHIPHYNIALSDVRFAYGDAEVLHGINLEIREKAVTALVGPSGGGKSTIAKLIASLWDVKSGQVCIGGVDIKTIPLYQLNSLVAYVSQDNYLFNDTIRNNIRMGKSGATDVEVEDAARACGCHDFIASLENGYDTVAGDAGSHLSGGERQRIAIARAMLKDAPIIIFDEATAYTDPENEALIQRAVSRLVQNKTLIVIAHRLSTIKNSQAIVVVDKGTIAATGTHEELLSQSPLYKSLWESHIEAADSALERDSKDGRHV